MRVECSRLAAAAVSVVSGVAMCAGLTAAGTESAAAGDDGLSAYQSQRVEWGACPPKHEELVAAGAECATISVPLDYADPGGRTIEIAISRLGATNREQRRGILLSNPGGPGGPGLDYPLMARQAMGKVAGQYDLIGFDPRFLGESTPLTCAPVQTGQTTRSFPASRGDDGRRDFEESVRDARDMARRCGSHGDNAQLLPHSSTRNVVRDMDVIRAALGEPAISYYGVSYGADLGAVYTELFPEHADRIVLDSSDDPSRSQYELFRQSGPAKEAALDEWAAWTARRDRTYKLGRTAGQARANVQRLLARADRRPITIDGHEVDDNVIRLILQQLVQYEEDNDPLARIMRNLREAAAGHNVEPEPELAELLELLKAPNLDDIFALPAFTMCADGGWPAGGFPEDPETYWRNIQADRAALPVFDEFVNGIVPCPFWVSDPVEPGTKIGNDVPVLMVQALRDNNTPHEGAVALHERLRSSRLVTADIRSHGAYGRAAEGRPPVLCVDETVNAYLANGHLPKRDIFCRS
jgi:pimeloyl-ACP methyl ester carboxylesterase